MIAAIIVNISSHTTIPKNFTLTLNSVQMQFLCTVFLCFNNLC